MARRTGLSHTSIHRIWKAHDLKPHRLETFKFITDPQAEERINDELLDLGNLLTFEQLEKELEVEFKLQTKIDRLFKRFFQIKGMKQIAGLTRSTAPALNGPAPVLEFTAQQPT